VWKPRKGEFNTFEAKGLPVTVTVKWSSGGIYAGLYTLEVAFNGGTAAARAYLSALTPRPGGLRFRDTRDIMKGAVYQSSDRERVLGVLGDVIDSLRDMPPTSTTPRRPLAPSRRGNRALRVGAALAEEGALAAVRELWWTAFRVTGETYSHLVGSGVAPRDAAALLQGRVESQAREIFFLAGGGWRPTHVSRGALRAIAGAVSSEDRIAVAGELQRAHGLLGRLSRIESCEEVLRRLAAGEFSGLDSLIGFYREHDATVILLKVEHNDRGGAGVPETDLVPIPERELFPDGKGISLRSKEVEWARRALGAG
jgi:hypothetical protein